MLSIHHRNEITREERIRKIWSSPSLPFSLTSEPSCQTGYSTDVWYRETCRSIGFKRHIDTHLVLNLYTASQQTRALINLQIWYITHVSPVRSAIMNPVSEPLLASIVHYAVEIVIP